VQGRVDKVFFWWSGDVCVQGFLRWVVEKKCYSEAADFEVSAVEGIKEGGVGRGAESARAVGGEGSVFEVCDRRGGGVDGEGRYGW
jgi:hypothetical protein